MPSNPLSRREILRRCWSGAGSVALTSLFLNEVAKAAEKKPANALGIKKPHLPPKAKNCIFLYMSGGVSQVDTFDYKPLLQKHAGKQMPKVGGLDGIVSSLVNAPNRVMPSPFPFKQFGNSGRYISTSYEHLGPMADEIAFLYGIHAESNQHGPATMQVNTGSVFQGSASVGAWVVYGLGSVNQNLPGFIVLQDGRGGPVNGPAVWQSGYLPASYQGTALRASGAPILDLNSPEGISRPRLRRELDLLKWINERHAARQSDSDELEARIEAYELAFRMQNEAPEVVDISGEPQHIQQMYGLDNEITSPFGRQCLLARRLVEKGVRFVMLAHGVEDSVVSWDHHRDLQDLLPLRIRETDQPIAALLKDLKQRGMLDDTLVVFTTEMGRTPMAQGAFGPQAGRDHNQHGMLSWMAGAGVKGGSTAGETDDFGLKAAGQALTIRDLHATLLQQLGLDQQVLTHLHEGRFKRLTDIGGRVLKEILHA
jgi:hypothetical protein